MSDHRYALTAIIALCLARGASGQAPDRLQFRADSLASAWREAQLLVAIQDSLRRTTLPAAMERAEAGSLVVLADPSRLPLKEATADAWRMLDDFYGDAARTVATRPVVVRVGGEMPRVPDRAAEILIPKTLSRADLALAIARIASVTRPDPAFAGWLGMTILPGFDPGREPRVVYVELVTAQAAIARRCFDGDRAACIDALELVPRDGAMQRWWTPAERRRVVAEHYASYYARNRPALRALTEACTLAAADSACVAILETADASTWPRPLSPTARALFVRTALEHGGRGAYAQLLADSSPPAVRLAAIAGVPLDSLVSAWRTTIVSARPRTVTVPLGNTLVALGWLALLMACALRSSRWRLG